MRDVARVLVADDSTTVRNLVARILTKGGFDVITAADGMEAYGQVLVGRPDVALLDWDMPGCSGLDLLRRLKADPATADVAVVMLTANTDREAVRTCLSAGAADYVRKPCDPSELVARLRNVSRSKLHLDALLRASTTDVLTGLPNQRGMAPVFAALQSPNMPMMGVVSIVIDGFATIVERHGSGIGDAVLRTVAGRLGASAARFTVARWGEIEFVAAGRVESPAALSRAADRFRRAVSAQPVEVDVDGSLLRLPVTVTVGATSVAVADDLDAALADAVGARQAAAEHGANSLGVLTVGVLRITGASGAPVTAPAPAASPVGAAPLVTT